MKRNFSSKKWKLDEKNGRRRQRWNFFLISKLRRRVGGGQHPVRHLTFDLVATGETARNKWKQKNDDGLVAFVLADSLVDSLPVATDDIPLLLLADPDGILTGSWRDLGWDLGLPDGGCILSRFFQDTNGIFGHWLTRLYLSGYCHAFWRDFFGIFSGCFWDSLGSFCSAIVPTCFKDSMDF